MKTIPAAHTEDRARDNGDDPAVEVVTLFLGLMAHDLRGSLNTIAGELLSRSVMENPPQ